MNQTKLFNVRDGQFLMKYIRDGIQFNTGEGLTHEIFEASGPWQLKSESAQIIRHILFTNPKIGLSKFPELYTSMFVLIAGKLQEKTTFQVRQQLEVICKD